MELTNQFINKKLLNSVKKLIFLLPFTVTTPSDSKGQLFVEALEVFFKTFQKNPEKMIKSIVPIVTKVKPHANFDVFNLDDFKSKLDEIVENHL